MLKRHGMRIDALRIERGRSDHVTLDCNLFPLSKLYQDERLVQEFLSRTRFSYFALK